MLFFVFLETIACFTKMWRKCAPSPKYFNARDSACISAYNTNELSLYYGAFRLRRSETPNSTQPVGSPSTETIPMHMVQGYQRTAFVDVSDTFGIRRGSAGKP